METKTCEMCGKEKPISEFSKSYRNRCRECVADMTKQKRQSDRIIKLTMSSIPETRYYPNAQLLLVQTAIAELIRKTDGRIMMYECEEIGQKAVIIANAALCRMNPDK